MTDALRAFRYVQISADEGTPGSAAAATEILYGVLTPPADDYVVVFPEGEERASLAARFANGFETGQIANMVFNGDVIFRHLPWWLCMAIRGNITATRPDPTNEPLAFLWTIEPNLAAANTPAITNGIDTFTIEFGDNVANYEVEFCHATRLQISGAPNEACKLAVNITGRQKATSEKTTGLSVKTLYRAPNNLAIYQRDADWASLGTTPKPGVVKAWTWTLDTMFTPRFCPDGTLYFTQLDEDAKSPELRLVMVRGTESEVMRAAFEAQSTVYIQMRLNGAVEMDEDQSNPPYLQIDGAYVIPTWPAWGDDQGMATVEVTLRGVYDSDGAKMMRMNLLCPLETYPT